MSRPSSVRSWKDAFHDLTILLVDDHPVFAEVLARCLFRMAEVGSIHLAHDLDRARAQVRQTRPDLILLDCHLGAESGLDLIEYVAHIGSDADVVVVSGSSQPHEVAEAFARGARGWVSKRGPVDDVLDAVVAVRGGEKYLAPTAVAPVMDFLVGRAIAPPRQRTFVDALTPRELEVLECLVSGMSRQEVAAQLFVSPNTVRTHVQKLLRSAKVHSMLALLAAAREAGLEPAGPQSAPRSTGFPVSSPPPTDLARPRPGVGLRARCARPPAGPGREGHLDAERLRVPVPPRARSTGAPSAHPIRLT